MRFFPFSHHQNRKNILSADVESQREKIQEVTASLAVAIEISMDAAVPQFDQKWMWHVGITRRTKNST